MSTDNIEVFISYSRDSPEHDARVLEFSDQLRADGIDATIDQYQSAPIDGWHLWMEKEIRDRDFVLLICTETYLRRVMKEETPGKGLGVLWESTIIYAHLYKAGGVSQKFIPIVLQTTDVPFIPGALETTTHYNVGTTAGYEDLYRRLTNQPRTPAQSLGKRRELPQRLRRSTSTPGQDTQTLAPNLVHPYPLQANFTGRVKERAELTAWLQDEEHPIYELIAMGGMGKSALTWYWLKYDLLPSSDRKLNGVMWWSFYEGESSFAKFVDEALKYVLNQPIDTERLPTTYDRAQELRKQLQNNRILFVLDGFERQLRAYGSLDAAHKSHDQIEPSAEARSCVDPITSRLLRDIASVTTLAKILLTSRLPLSDLQDRAGEPLAGVIERDLAQMSRDDAIAFMQAQGVKKGTDAEIAQVCESYGYHALSLRLLSGLIAHDAKTPGDIAAAPRHDVHDDLVQRQHHVLQQSYDALPKRERALLSRIAAFRGPMNYEAISIFNTLDSENRFEEALEDLRVRGLLQRDNHTNRYDLHPIIRHYAYDRLTDKTATHTRLRDYFAGIPASNRVQSLEDLAPVVELYHHTVGAGQYDQAFDLFANRLSDFLYYQFGAYQLAIELLRVLFPRGENYPPQLHVERQAAAVIRLANSYCAFGRPRRAIPLYELSAAIREGQGQKQDLAISLGAVAKAAYFPLGEFVMVETNLKRQLELNQEKNSELINAMAHHELGRMFSFRGSFDEAERQFDTAEASARRIQHEQGRGLIEADRAMCALLMGNTRVSVDRARQALALANFRRYERDIVRAEWLLGSGLTMEGTELATAADHLSDALTRCRRINLVELEPAILLDFARWHRANDNAEEARTYAEDALAIADRCEFRLVQADIHNFLAHSALNGGDADEARKEASIARERAWCDGPPYCYKPALDEAERLLGEIDAQ